MSRASHRQVSVGIHLWDYFGAIYSVYVAVEVCRDTSHRRNYPFGACGYLPDGVCSFGQDCGSLASTLAATQLFWTGITAISIAASSLVLVEGIRWSEDSDTDPGNCRNSLSFTRIGL